MQFIIHLSVWLQLMPNQTSKTVLSTHLGQYFQSIQIHRGNIQQVLEKHLIKIFIVNNKCFWDESVISFVLSGLGDKPIFINSSDTLNFTNDLGKDTESFIFFMNLNDSGNRYKLSFFSMHYCFNCIFLQINIWMICRIQ